MLCQWSLAIQDMILRLSIINVPQTLMLIHSLSLTFPQACVPS